MSTILKALRRVEEERPGAPAAPRRAVRGDFVAGSGEPPPPRRSKRRAPNLKLWGSLAAVVLLGALVWWRLPRPEQELVQAAPPPRAERSATPTTPPAPAVPQPAPPAPAAPVAVAPPPAPPPRAEAPPAAPPPPVANEVPVEVAERLPPLGAPLEAPPVAPESPPPPAPSPTRASPPPAPPPDVAVVAPAPPPEAPAPRVVAPKPEPAPVVKPQAKPKPKPAPVAAKPKLAPAPSAPGLEVERTSWHPKAERRIAWVRVEGLADTRELHEGDVVGALVVKEIRPSSVVFQHGAEEIQRRVGQH